MPEWQPPGELTMTTILWGFCPQCPCPPNYTQPTPISPGDPPRLIGRFSPGSYEVTVLCWIPVYVKTFVHPPIVESLFPPVLWCSCTPPPLVFKAKCFGDSSSYSHTLMLGNLMWGSGLSFLWENLCDMIFFQFMGLPPSGYGI